MPVATLANVKTMTPKELVEIGVNTVICNTLHLYTRPGVEIIEKAGGLHKFMGWERPIVTDSGGFQVFSLSDIREIKEDGVVFASPFDGSKHFLTPEKVLEIQYSLGSDIIHPLDICPPYPVSKKEAEKAVKKTIEWARISKKIHEERGTHQALFGIVQGSTYHDLRKLAVEETVSLEFDGYSIGGVAVGESKEELLDISSYTASLLPEDKIRYLMGVGEPRDLLDCISFGVDLFDCVIPTRNGRTGTLYTWHGKINIKNAKYKEDFSPIDENCSCYVCRTFTRAYLRHLFVTHELLAQRLGTIHNLHFFMELMREAREHIKKGDFKEWSEKVKGGMHG